RPRPRGQLRGQGSRDGRTKHHRGGASLMAKKTARQKPASAAAAAPSSYEGRQDHIPGMKMPEIETWTFMYPGSATHLEVSVPEFTCICPKTGLPDFATLVISYVPDKLCLELKSFKEYINSYRDLGIFHEHVVNRVLAD